MALRSQVVFWSVTFAAFLILFYIFSPILLPFVAGAALAYALDPIADWLQRHGFSRIWATIVILLVFLIVFVILLLALVPILVNQLTGLIANIPDYVDRLQALVSAALGSRAADFLGIDSETLRSNITSLMNQGARWLTTLLVSIWSGGAALINLLSLLVVTPVVAFYLLYDWDRMVAYIDSWLPRDHAPALRQIGAEMGDAISGFVRGQGLLCLILGAFYAIGLAAIGLNFGLLIGFGAGLLSFIPYVGTVIGFVVSIGVALVQFWPDWWWIGATAGIFMFGQFIEGNILQPKLVGDSVGLHPVWMMFALLAFAYLFGFLGLLVAVPVAAAIGVLVRFGLRQYLASPYYKGTIETTDLTNPAAPPRRRVNKR